ncbi:MAG: GDSL-type esterase/lipase family protein [Mucinivorans sp.]
MYRNRIGQLLLSTLLLLGVAVAQAQTRVACVGNSVTYGAGLADRDKDAYPSVLGRLLGINYTVENFGRNGATLLSHGHNPYIKTEQYAQALKFKPDIVVIHLGLNDTDPRNWPLYKDEFRPDYAALIESFRQANPKARVIIARMSPIAHRHARFKAGTREWYRQIQTAIEQVAKTNHVELIDFQDVLYSHPELLPDAIHPNIEGAQMLANRVYSSITGDFGGVALNDYYTDNMVLQRGGKICGRANAGQTIKVKLGKATTQTKADINGQWQVEVPVKEYAKNLSLIISSDKKTIAMNGVCVGEVWILSGQSNMSLGINQTAKPEQAIPNEDIHLFKCIPTFENQDSLSEKKLNELNHLQYINSTGWQKATKEEVNEFSAVGYYFGQALADSLKGVSIGLIQTSLGGATAESFVDRQSLEDNPWLCDLLYNPRSNPMIMEWCRGIIAQNLKGATNPLQRHFYEPAYLWEARMAQLRSYSFKGVLWYQGESNAENVELHERIFTTLVSAWRKNFNYPEMPFYFVQLSSLNRPSWAEFRDSQRKLSSEIENCEMVVSHDWGNDTDVHPRNKRPIGERLAATALAHDYGFKIEYHSPEIVNAKYQNGTITVQLSQEIHTANSQEAAVFEVASEDEVFILATKVSIYGNKISIESPVKNPCYLRYAWQPIAKGNVVNQNGLPMSTTLIKVE